MAPDRRWFLGGAALLVGSVAVRPARAQAANQWFPLTSDDGRPVPNLRVPIELVEEAEDLPGALWGGPKTASVTLVEFYDYNCPWCRAASADLGALMASRGDLRVGLVNNPILAPGSMQAAKVVLALLSLAGAEAAYRLHARLYATSGRIDGIRALEAAAALGHDRAALERRADGNEVRTSLGKQTRLARSIGLVATPSYLVGGAAVLGYPGPRSLARIVADAQLCGTVTCRTGGSPG